MYRDAHERANLKIRNMIRNDIKTRNDSKLDDGNELEMEIQIRSKKASKTYKSSDCGQELGLHGLFLGKSTAN